MNDLEAIESFLAVAGRCSRCAVLTGAGVSAESGGPTFRGAKAGAFVVEVNTEDTAFTPLSDLVFRGPAGEWLPRLFG